MRTTGKGHPHINFNIFTLLVESMFHIERPQYARNVNSHRRRSEVHSRANAAAPAKGTVAKVARILPFVEEAFWAELVRVREVGFIKMD